jgi:enoyl-CoA hydratase/carnithine racemase
MADQVVKVRVEDELAYVGLNRPEKRNSINNEVLPALREALAQADQVSVRAIILYGEGPVFSAGVDFNSLSGNGGSKEAPSSDRRSTVARLRNFITEAQSALNYLENIEKPIIAALHGYVGGLGLELALACDARICATGTRLGMPEVRIGLIPDVGGTTRLTRTVGYANAKELIMTARMIAPEEALRIGLVNRVVGAGAHLSAAEELAREIARNAPLAVGLAKKIIDRGHGVDKMTFMEFEALAQSLLLQTEDFVEGAQALAQRRDPIFKGR